MRKLLRASMLVVVSIFLLFSTVHAAFAESDPSVPSHINDILSKYKEIQEKENLGYEFLGVTVYSPFFLDNVQFYKILFYTETDSGQILFSKYPNGYASKGFAIAISSLSQYTARNFTALTMAVIDDGLSYKNACAIAKEFLSTYDGNTEYSEVITVGDYALLFYIAPNDQFVLNVTHNSEINAPVDKNLYRNASYKEIVSARSSGEKVYVTGRVEKQYTAYSESVPIEFVIFSSAGKQYRAQFLYTSFPEKFAVGKTYTFYGNVVLPQENGYACLNLHYFEE